MSGETFQGPNVRMPYVAQIQRLVSARRVQRVPERRGNPSSRLNIASEACVKAMLSDSDWTST